MITPAISVLGAVEGMGVATPALPEWVVPLVAALILVALFLFQRRGTARVGAVFGRVMLVWFASIAALGVGGILLHPERAPGPQSLVRDRVLVRTTARGVSDPRAPSCWWSPEPRRCMPTWGTSARGPSGSPGLPWCLPALTLNYFGQGALLIADPATAGNPFYGLVPQWALYPMVIVATAAAVVASQALISGAFSLTRQAVQLGYSPRVTIQHTSQTEIGQIYLPGVNRTLAVSCVLLVLGFRSDDNLASAYGIAVTGTMTITTILFCMVARDRWNWSRGAGGTLGALFLVVDLSFLAANLVKIAKGGWFPLLVARSGLSTDDHLEARARNSHRHPAGQCAADCTCFSRTSAGASHPGSRERRSS